VVALAIPALLLMLQRLGDVPRSVLVLHPILLVLIMGGSRFPVSRLEGRAADIAAAALIRNQCS
jgi:hypothetical protein